MTFSSGCTKEPVPDDSDHYGWIISGSSKGYAGYYFTPNEGFEWNRLGVPGLMYDIAFNDLAIMTGSEVWLCGPVYDGYGILLLTSENGYVIHRMGSKALLQNINLHMVHARSDQEVWIGGTNTFCARSYDGGLSWSSIPLDSMSMVTWISMADAGNDSLWIAGNAFGPEDSASIVCLISADNGISWQTSGHELFQNNLCTKILAINDSVLLMSTRNGLLRSTTRGFEWEMLFHASEDQLTSCVAPQMNEYWFTTLNGFLFCSTDTGVTWKNQKPHPDGFSLTDICFCSPNRIWITASDALASKKGAVLYSRDKGKNWFIQDIPDKPPVRKISMIAANH